MKKRKEIDTKELNTLIERARARMSKKTTKFITSIQKEIEEVDEIRLKYDLNKYNFELFKKKSDKITNFPNEIVRFWRDNLTEL